MNFKESGRNPVCAHSLKMEDSFVLKFNKANGTEAWESET